jgi:hypothetical protein
MSKSSSAKKFSKYTRAGYSVTHVGKNTVVVVRPVSRDVIETTVRIAADDDEAATTTASSEQAAARH